MGSEEIEVFRTKPQRSDFSSSVFPSLTSYAVSRASRIAERGGRKRFWRATKSFWILSGDLSFHPRSE
ncbi:hypothetical protein ANANG_G00120110 [Anguilla anguilla]|uniref:Uncharacterized protein n=1 Tax=Anguilla anguilla TaxID=7936 RepID=A0A9D3MIX0_ANGAN|nr:hypothetical protein ANANG_G00120110 [Anguilla anguilla]